jgi:hypothetical protein
MQRREFLIGLASVPLAGAIGGCRHHAGPNPPGISSGYHTLQVGLEGSFALVIRKDQGNRITAFLPAPPKEPQWPSQIREPHRFYFNDPLKELPPQNSYHFELVRTGTKDAHKPHEPYKPYINPGFSDFNAEVGTWHLGENIATIDLPRPDSINFSGRPQPVTFNDGRGGWMPTSHILEYYVEEQEDITMRCGQLKKDVCRPIPQCPPGIARFFFGAAPREWDGRPFDGKPFDDGHAVAFFNFTLTTRFPELVARYSVSQIGPPRPKDNEGRQMKPASLRNLESRPHFTPASATVDCQSGGILVSTSSGPVS